MIVCMDDNQQRELRERVAHYRCLRRMTLDKRALGALDHLIAEAEVQLQHLEGPGKVRRLP